MKTKPTLLTFILAGTLALAMLAGSIMHANAADKRVLKYPAVLTFKTIPDIGLGKPITLSGYLKSNTDVAVPYTHVVFTVDGTKIGEILTNESGYFQHTFTNKLQAGTHYVAGTTQNSRYFLGTTGSINFFIQPADVRVQTVPPTPGLPFYMAGTSFFAGPDGVAHVMISEPGKYELTVLPDQYNNPDQRIQFSRWVDDVYQPSEVITVPSDIVPVVGLNVYQKVGETFMDLSGYPVDPARVKQFTIRSAQGDLFTFSDGKPAWIPASRVARFKSGLVVTNLQYSVIDMQVDGSNVVNKSQQRFFAHPNDTWKISLILYTLNIHANDGLFGSAVGESVNLVYPDRHIQDYPLDQNGNASIHGLARGNYTVQLLKAKGLKQVVPVALSRSQTVEINVPTILDMAVIGGLGLLIGLSLIVFPRLPPRRSSAKSRRPAFQSPQNALVKSNDLQMVEQEAESTERGIIKWS